MEKFPSTLRKSVHLNAPVLNFAINKEIIPLREISQHGVSPLCQTWISGKRQNKRFFFRFSIKTTSSSRGSAASVKIPGAAFKHFSSAGSI